MSSGDLAQAAPGALVITDDALQQYEQDGLPEFGSEEEYQRRQVASPPLWKEEERRDQIVAGAGEYGRQDPGPRNPKQSDFARAKDDLASLPQQIMDFTEKPVPADLSGVSLKIDYDQFDMEPISPLRKAPTDAAMPKTSGIQQWKTEKLQADRQPYLERGMNYMLGRLEELRGEGRDWDRWMAQRAPFVPLDAAFTLVEAGAASKVEREPETATEGDWENVAKMIAHAEYQANRGWLGNVEDIITQMPTFMFEMILTRGAFKAPKMAIGRLASKLTGSGQVGAWAKATAGRAAGIGVQTAATPSRWMNPAARHMAPEFDVRENEAGEYRLAETDPEMEDAVSKIVAEHGDGIAEALLKGYIEGGIETGSERFGKVAGKWLKPAKARLARTVIGSALTKYTPKQLTDILAKGGFNGIAEEYLEERVGEIARGATDLGPEAMNLEQGYGVTGNVVGAVGSAAQGNWEEAGAQAGEALKQSSMEIASFAPITGVPAAVGAAGKKIEAKRFYKDPRAVHGYIENQITPETLAKLVSSKEPSRKLFSDLGLPPMGNADDRRTFQETAAYMEETKQVLAGADKMTLEEIDKHWKESTKVARDTPDSKKPLAAAGLQRYQALGELWREKRMKQEAESLLAESPAADPIEATRPTPEQVQAETENGAAAAGEFTPEIETGPVVSTITPTPKPVPGLPEDEKEPPKQRVIAADPFETFAPSKTFADAMQSPNKQGDTETVGQHTQKVLENFRASAEEPELADLSKQSGVDMRRLIEHAVALHDIGKADSIAKHGKTGRQHEFTPMHVMREMKEAGFSPKEIKIATAIVEADPIGEAVQGKITMQQAVKQIDASAKKAGMPPLALFQTLSMLYRADAGSYDKLKKEFFYEAAGKQKIADPVFGILEEAFYGEVRETPWIGRVGGLVGGKAPSRSGYRGSTGFRHGTAVEIKSFSGDLDRGERNAVGPGTYLVATEDEDVADHYADRAVKRILKLFDQPTQDRLTKGTPEGLRRSADYAGRREEAARRSGKPSEAVRWAEARDIIQKMADGLIGKKAIPVEFNPARMFDFGAQDSGGRMVRPAEVAGVYASLGMPPITQSARSFEIYKKLTSRFGKSRVNKAFREAGYDSFHFVHTRGNYTRPYSAFVSLDHAAAKPEVKPDTKPTTAPEQTPKPETKPTLAAWQDGVDVTLAKLGGGKPADWVPLLDAVRRDARKAVFDDKRQFDAAVAAGETPEHTLVSGPDHFARQYVRNEVLKSRPDKDINSSFGSELTHRAKQAHMWATDALRNNEITDAETSHDWLVPTIAIPGAVKAEPKVEKKEEKPEERPPAVEPKAEPAKTEQELLDDMTRAALDEVFGRGPASQAAGQPKSQPASGPKKPRPPRIKPPAKSAEELHAEAQEKLKKAADLLRKFAEIVNASASANLPSPEAMRVMAQAAKMAVDAGVLEFKAFVAFARDTLGAEFVIKHDGALQNVWKMLKDYGAKVDTPSPVADILKAQPAPAPPPAPAPAPPKTPSPPKKTKAPPAPELSAEQLKALEDALEKQRGITIGSGSDNWGSTWWTVTNQPRGKGSKAIFNENTTAIKKVAGRLQGRYDPVNRNWVFRGGRPTEQLAGLLVTDSAGQDAGQVAAGGPGGTDPAGAGAVGGDGTGVGGGLPDRRKADGAYRDLVSPGVQDLIRRGEAVNIPKAIGDAQIADVGMIVDAYENGRKVFLVASKPGSGKTYVLGGAMRELLDRGQKDIIYVTTSQRLISQVKANLADYGIDKVKIVTYAWLRENPTMNAKGAVVVFDEAHNVKNQGSLQGAVGEKLMEQAKFTVLASATPFQNPLEARYLEPTGVFADEAYLWAGATRKSAVELKGFEAWAVQHGVEPNVHADGSVSLKWHGGRNYRSQQIAARDWFVRNGMFTQRPITLPPGMVTSPLKRVKVSEEHRVLYEKAMDAYDLAYSEAMSRNKKQLAAGIQMHRANMMKRILEASKVDSAIAEAKSHIANGKQVVIFVETKAEREVGRFRLRGAKGSGKLHTYAEMVEITRQYRRKQYRTHDGKPPFADMIMEIAKAMNALGVDATLPSTIEMVEKNFAPDRRVEYTGRLSDKKANAQLDDWLAGNRDLLVATMAKGGTGLSLHDTTGTMPQRVQIGLNLPWTATQIEQVGGRLPRYGVAKPVEVKWLFADNIPFERGLAVKVGKRMQDMGAIVSGIDLEAGEQVEDFGLGDDDALPDVQPVSPSMPHSKTAVLGNETHVDIPGGKPLPAQYAVIEMKDLLPSHSFLSSMAFAPVENKNYPVGIQPRDYSPGSPSTTKAITNAQLHEYAYWLSEHPAADNGPPSVTPDGIVLNGNSRVMSIQRMEPEHQAGYKKALIARANVFGVNAGAIEQMSLPVLVRVVPLEADSAEASSFADIGNNQTGMAQSPMRLAASMSRNLPKDLFDGAVGDGDKTLADMMNEGASGKRFRDKLYNAMPATMRAPYFTDERLLTEAGKEFVTMLAVLQVAPIEVSEKLYNNRKSLFNLYAALSPQFIAIATKYPEFNLIPQAQEALSILARRTDVTSVAHVNDMFVQGMFFGDLKESASPGGRMMLDFFVTGKIGDSRKRLKEFVESLDDTKKNLFDDNTGERLDKLAEILGVAKRHDATFGWSATEGSGEHAMILAERRHNDRPNDQASERQFADEIVKHTPSVSHEQAKSLVSIWKSWAENYLKTTFSDMMATKFARITGAAPGPGALWQGRNLEGGLYSKLLEVIDTKLPNKFTKEQAMATLEGAGLKKEEIEQALRGAGPLRGDSTMTREELRNLASLFVAPNIVRVVEKSWKRHSGLMDERSAARQQAQAFYANNLIEEQSFWESRYDELTRQIGPARPQYDSTDYRSPAINNEDYREWLFTNQDAEKWESAYEHWARHGVKGVIAHARGGEAQINGARSILLEEIQADPHQIGFKVGYEGEGTEPQGIARAKKNIVKAMLAKGYDQSEAEAFVHSYENQVNTDKVFPWRKSLPGKIPAASYFTAEAARNNFMEELNRLKQLYKLWDALNGGNMDQRPPRVVFAGDAWAELVLKKMLYTAAAEGYDKLAVIAGKSQAFAKSQGNEGLAAYYDKVVPSILGKLVKRFKAKVEAEGIAHETAVERKWSHFTANHSRLAVSLGDTYANIDIERGPGAFWGVRMPNGVTKHFGDYQLAMDHANEFADQWIQEGRDTFDLAIHVNSVTITPAMRAEILRDGFPLFQQSSGGPKAAVSFTQEGRAVIHAFQRSDVSSHLHEFAHVASRWLHPEDMSVVNRWLGNAPTAGWETWTVAQHEKFATGFEQFWLTQKAPSGKLKKVFEKLQGWMREIYKSLSSSMNGLAQPSPEVTQVYLKLIGGVTQEQEEASIAKEQASAPASGELAKSVYSNSYPTSITNTNPNGETISRHGVVARLREDFGVVLRMNRMNNAKAAGLYDLFDKVIRLQGFVAADLAVFTHELAHWIDTTTSNWGRNKAAGALTGAPQFFQDRIAVLDYAFDPMKPRPHEGFAEFVRIWMTRDGIDDVDPSRTPSEQAARNNAIATFTPWWEKWLDQNPEYAAKIKRGRDNIRTWRGMSPLQRAEAGVGKPQGWWSRTAQAISGQMPAGAQSKLTEDPYDWLEYKQSRTWNWIVGAWHRQYQLWKYSGHTGDRVHEMAKRSGRKYQPDETPFNSLAAAFIRAAPQHAMSAARHGVHLPTASNNLIVGTQALLDVLRDIRVNSPDEKEFHGYMHARHTIAEFDYREANKLKHYNTNLDIEDARRIVAGVNADAAKKARYELAAAGVSRFNNDLLHMLAESGVITFEAMQRMMDAHPFYLPMERVQASWLKKLGNKITGGSQDPSTRDPFQRRATEGSDLQILNIVETTLARANRFYATALRQQVAEQMVRELDPRIGGAQLPGPGTGLWLERLSPKKFQEKVNVGRILSQLVDMGIVQQADADAMVKSNDPRLAEFVFQWRNLYESDPENNIIMVRIDGELRMYEVDKDLMQTLTMLEPRIAGEFFKQMGKLSRFRKLGATGLSQTFPVKNVIRDYFNYQLTSLEAGLLESLYGPVIWSIAFLGSEMHRISGGRTGVANEGVEAWQQQSGNIVSIVQVESQKSLSGARKSVTGKRVNKFTDTISKDPRDYIELAKATIAFSEVGPRLTEFNASMRRSGYKINMKTGKYVPMRPGLPTRPRRDPLVRAINAANDLFNFKRFGTGGLHVETIMPFFNATLEGIDKSRRLIGTAIHDDDKHRQDNARKRLVIWTTVLFAARWVYNEMTGDDDDTEEQEDFLDASWVIKNAQGDPIHAIPVGHGFAQLATAMADTLWRLTRQASYGGQKDPYGSLKTFARGQSPFSKPVLFGDGYEVAADYDLFRRRAIGGREFENTANWRQFRPDTGPVAKALSLHIGQYVGLSPLEIEHLFNSVSGGLYDQTVGKLERIFGGHATTKDIPFVTATEMERDYTASENDFYEMLGSYKTDDTTAGKDGKELPPEAEARLQVLERYHKIMAAIRKARDEEFPDHPNREERFSYNRYLTGLARSALDKRELARYPNPLRMTTEERREQLPDSLRETMEHQIGLLLLAASEAAIEDSDKKADETDDQFWDRQEQREQQRETAVAMLGESAMTSEEREQVFTDYWLRRGNRVGTPSDAPIFHSRLRRLREALP